MDNYYPKARGQSIATNKTNFILKYNQAFIKLKKSLVFEFDSKVLKYKVKL